MSMLRKLSLRNYWSFRPIIHTPYAASVGMSRDKFLELMAMFHLNNNDAKVAEGQPPCDLWSTIQNSTRYWHTHYKFQDVYTLSTRQCAHFLCVYIKGNHHKYGMIRFVLHVAKSGYIYNLEINTGTQPTKLEHNMAFSIVHRVCDKTIGRANVCTWTHGSPVQRSLTI
jgi:hypothetical protein